ncbi:ABC transporter permease [Nocardioides cavernaquae]|uniref:ABC transporter permease n=1 Tax=Nocardioides cavernaquae TaxID=2321396 RepID=A0A3A5HBA3_9ACTN|nr:ABC transporter permease [Nocardioides cavernaquae]RJS47381.1 ABC transporter permease [Nocardioides cavernaquae]
MTLPASEVVAHEATPVGEVEPEGAKVAGRSPTQLAIARFRKDKLSMVALGICAFYIISAILAPILDKFGVLTPNDFHQDLLNISLGGIPEGAMGGASWSHPLGVVPGTGNDLLSRLMLGITWSLGIALTGTIFTLVLGAIFGIVSGFSGGWVDAIIGRLIDLTLSFPQTLMLLALYGAALIFLTENLHIGNRDLASAVFVIGILSAFGWPPVARVVRGQVLSLREREYVEAARLFGASRFRIYFKEILPNLWAPLLVYFTLLLPAYVSAEAAFSFLGVGVKPPTPTLGNILADSVSYSTADPSFFFFPGFLIAIIVISFNLLGDGLRDALDPKSGR